MGLASIGVLTADWETKDELLFPSVDLKDDKSYLFFIRTVTPGISTKNQYLNLIAELSSDEGPIETVLEAKFFPKGRMLQFSVAVPKLSFYNDPQCRIIALPKEFYPGTATDSQLLVELLWEDKEDFEAKSVSL